MSEISYRVSNMDESEICNFINNILENYLSYATRIENDDDINNINSESIIIFEIPSESNLVNICLIKDKLNGKNYSLYQIATYDPNKKEIKINNSSDSTFFENILLNQNSYRYTLLNQNKYIFYDTYVINII